MKEIRSTRTINFRDTHKGRGFAVRGIDRQLAFSHKRRAQAMKSIHECVFRRERDLETRVCARGAKLSLKSLSKRLESPQRGSRGLIYDLRRRRGLRGSKESPDLEAEKFAKLDLNCG
jgi:hypothetical protein